MKKYFPYKSDKPEKKYFIITENNKKVYFGAAGYNDYPTYYKNFGKEFADKKKEAYISRHKNNEDWTKSGINSAGFFAKWILWNKPTIKESYEFIKSKFL